MCSNTATGGVTATLATTHDAVATLVQDVLAGGLRHESHDQLAALLRATRRLQARLDYVVLAAVREVDTRGSHIEDGALTIAAWTRMQTRMTPGQATAAVTTARALSSGAMPATAAALAAGDIDPAHARTLAAGAADTPDGAFALIEDEALTLAREADPRHIAALMRRFAHALDPDSADHAALKRHDRRGITLSPTPDGTVHIRGLADDVNGALLMTAIDTASPLVAGETRTPAQRRLDALADICRRYLASPDTPTVGGGHAHLIVTLDANDLTTDAQTTRDGDPTDQADGDARRAEPGAGPGATLSWVGPITASTARRIACDADVTIVSVDQHGAAQVVKRERRFFTAAQKKAMIARDGDRCCVPYCDRPITWADGHHITFWAHGGPTRTSNGALPCAAHHPMFHEGGWTLHRTPDGRYLIKRNGRTIGPEPHPPGHNKPLRDPHARC